MDVKRNDVYLLPDQKEWGGLKNLTKEETQVLQKQTGMISPENSQIQKP